MASSAGPDSRQKSKCSFPNSSLRDEKLTAKLPVLPNTKSLIASGPSVPRKPTTVHAPGDKPTWFITFDDLEGQSTSMPRKLPSKPVIGTTIKKGKTKSRMQSEARALELHNLYNSCSVSLCSVLKTDPDNIKRVSYEARRFVEVRRLQAEVAPSVGVRVVEQLWADYSGLFVEDDGFDPKDYRLTYYQKFGRPPRTRQ